MTTSPRSDPAATPEAPSTDWSTGLDTALRGDGVEIHYQPVVDLARAEVVGHEALLRFPGHEVTAPSPWLKAAHDLGRGAELEALALRLAFADRPHLPDDTFLAVNVLPDVLDHPEVRAVLDDQPSLDGVVIELTEHMRVPCYDALQPRLDRLRTAGAVVAVDDAGAGYAGLQHLIGIRPDLIKIDRALIAGIDRDHARRMLVDMIGTFASRSGAAILAEGVETAEELETLTGLGVPLAQGYHLARPGPGWQSLTEATITELRGCVQRPAGATLRRLLEAKPAFGDLCADATSEQSAGLRVHVDSDISTSMIRAMARGPEHRFSPLQCTDDSGRFVGLVRIERAVEFLAAGALGHTPD